MANPKSYFLVMTLLVLAGTQVLSDERVSDKCKDKLPELISQCTKFVMKKGPKIPPSPQCCQVLTSIGIPCVCKFVTPNIEKLISMDKAVYVARTCGIKVVSGAKCGSYTVPPLA